ncbi:laminin subunit gamma-1-like [Uranotaenia lowii]|uniref:laminin subunit gamma-1-like n=1 Tax=Uranotaenia lowii TaxID=190385 RepID=UPI002478CF31|nr:laminin subunit gamma-1-like [Uranotaenia lowii]
MIRMSFLTTSSFFASAKRWRTIGWWIVLLLVHRLMATDIGSSDDHICIRYESFTELETVPRNETIQILTREWCLEIPPRCTSYRPELKEVFVKQNVTKTRRIEFCCEGFEERLEETVTFEGISSPPKNSTIRLNCRPICRGGCGRGTCEAPNQCSCEAGFTGKHCTQRCRNGTWGENCKHRCHCQNHSLCDGKTGHCRCSDGWIGNHCESPCPAGHFGTMCKSKCHCNTSRCHHISGKCLADHSQVMFENITRIVENITSGESTERISAEQWIKIETEPVSPSTTSTTTSIPNNATYAQSFQEYIPSNVSVSFVPLENLTTTTEATLINDSTIYEILATTTKYEITFINTSVEDVSSQSDAENITSSSEPSEFVFVESEERSDLIEFVDDKDYDEKEQEVNHKQAVITISCLLLTLGLLLSVVAYMKKINRRAIEVQRQKQLPALHCKTVITKGPDSPRVLEPLPEPPHVIYTRVKAKNQRNALNAQIEHYDVPINNSSVSPFQFPVINGVVKLDGTQARKYSMEHIYDEIQYPALGDPNEQQQQQRADDNGDVNSIECWPAKVAPVKVIDEIKGK